MSDERMWLDWPRCAGCGRRRQTFCPACRGAGMQFPLADYQGGAEPQRATRARDRSDAVANTPPMLVCPRCDEAFVPRFYRLCPACDWDDGEGIDTQRPDREPSSNRALLAVCGLLAVMCGALLYLWLLWR